MQSHIKVGCWTITTMDSNIIIGIIASILSVITSVLISYPSYRSCYKTKAKNKQKFFYKHLTASNSKHIISILKSFWKRPILILFGSLILGSITISLRPYSNFGSFHLELISALILMITCSFLISISNRKNGPFGRFHCENTSLWAGFISDWCFLHLGSFSYFLQFILYYGLFGVLMGQLLF